MSKKIKIYSSIIVLLTVLVLIVSVQPAKAQFVIAWDYDSEAGNNFDYDAYGQGFYLYNLMTNYTSADWNLYPDYAGTHYFNETSYAYEWSVGYAIGVRFLVWMNSTLTGASTLTDGLDYIRLNATITGLGGVELDRQDDLTAFYQTSNFDAEMWLYGFNAFFNVIAEEALIYTVTLTYEVYW